MDLRRILNDCSSSRLESSVRATTTTPATLRAGKWTNEEERFAASLVKHFVAGTLSIPTGTSLRSFVAKKLRCSAMRVSTKLSMDTLSDLKIPKKLGQKRFFPVDGLADAQRQRVARELHYLESTFLQKENLAVVVLAEKEQAVAMEPAASCSSEDECEVPLRVGSWSDEEQAYACALIDAFFGGLVNVVDGTTLRAFLADRLCCNPMRISKKLATGKMATMTIPKRLGSSVYQRHAHAAPGAILHTENQLQRFRVSCFSTSPQPVCFMLVHSHHRQQHQEQRVFTPPAQQRHQLPPAMAVSPMQSRLKRKFLPPIELPLRALHTTAVRPNKKMRPPSMTSIAFY